MLRSLVGSEMCIRDRYYDVTGKRCTNADTVAAKGSDTLNVRLNVPPKRLTIPSSLTILVPTAKASLKTACSPDTHSLTPVLCVDTVSYTHLTLPTKRIV
eukprot:TRINITY_DN2863_c0_g1_i2.p1 TRINITY_DN2863_c0_g1~~TRINITY_DN2863_c0_g1_i2.p1  ORF type:complete len:100 (+),score=14.06 TRINITY_DN2863_c0_g1_i2:153-452(+)